MVWCFNHSAQASFETFSKIFFPTHLGMEQNQAPQLLKTIKKTT